MAEYCDRYSKIAKEIIQARIDLEAFTKDLRLHSLLSVAESEEVQLSGSRDLLRAWKGVLVKLSSEDKHKAVLGCLKRLSTTVSTATETLRPTIRHLEQLWMDSGHKKVAIFANSHQYKVHLAGKQPVILELPKVHVSNVTNLKSVLVKLGYTICEVDMSISTLSNKREDDLEQLVLSVQEGAEVIVCLSGVVTMARVLDSVSGVLLYNDAVIPMPEATEFKPVGLLVSDLYRMFSMFPRCNITLLADCLPFRLSPKEQTSIWELLFGPRFRRTGNSRHQIVSGLVTFYSYSFEQYATACLGPQHQDFANWMAFVDGTYSLPTKLLSWAFDFYITRGCPAITFPELHEMLSSWLLDEVAGVSSDPNWTPPDISLHGHKHKCPLSATVTSWQRWFRSRPIEDPSSESLSCWVPAGKSQGLDQSCSLLLYHCQDPLTKVKASVVKEHGPFLSEVTITNQEDIKRIKALLHTVKVPVGQTLCVLVVSKQRHSYRVAISQSVPPNKIAALRQLIDYIETQSCRLAYSFLDDNEPNRQDHCKVTYDSLRKCFVVSNLKLPMATFMEQDSLELARILETCAHFQLGMEICQHQVPSMAYKCCVTHKKNRLLVSTCYSETTLISGRGFQFKMSASSEKGKNNEPSQGVHREDDDIHCWKPHAQDLSPHLQVDASCNVNVTSFEFKGDSQTDEYVKSLELVYCLRMGRTEEVLLTPLRASVVLDVINFDDSNFECRFEEAGVTRMELEISEWNPPGTELRMRLLQHNNTPITEIAVLRAPLDPESSRQPRGPLYELKDGVLLLRANPARSRETVVLELSGAGKVAKVDLTADFPEREEECSLSVVINYFGKDHRLNLSASSSGFAIVVKLERFITASRFRFRPKDSHKGVALQVQIFGSPTCYSGNPLVVRDGDVMQLNLAAYSKPLFFNVVLFEYTGAVSILYQNVCVLPWTLYEAYFRVFISEELSAREDSILDTYRVFTSTRNLDLTYLTQRGPLEYHHRRPGSDLWGSGYQSREEEVTQKTWDVVDLPLRVQRWP